ncbi:hypothetical protein WJX77_008312 [Trebouxia sp. C0004]
MACRSGASSEHKRRRQPFLKGVTEPLYLNYCCEAKQVPIKLLHPVFDRFVKLSETLEAEPSILLLVEELCASARYYYAGEKHYQPVLEKLLQRFLNTTGAGTLQGLSVGASNSTTDTSLAGSYGLVLVASFILELMGSHMRIGGAVWGERVQYEPLTDVMNLLPLWQQEFVQLRLARQMQALCICAKELLAEYSVQPPGISTQRSLLYANGIPPVLHDATRFTNVQPFLQGSQRYPTLRLVTDAAAKLTVWWSHNLGQINFLVATCWFGDDTLSGLVKLQGFEHGLIGKCRGVRRSVPWMSVQAEMLEPKSFTGMTAGTLDRFGGHGQDGQTLVLGSLVESVKTIVEMLTRIQDTASDAFDNIFAPTISDLSQHTNLVTKTCTTAYNAEDHPKDQLWCMVLGRYLQKHLIKASHIYKRRWPVSYAAKLHLDVDSAANMFSAQKKIESAFDRCIFWILPWVLR